MVNRFAAKPRLLVVDDEPSQLITLRDLFEAEGFHVDSCDAFQQAINYVQDHVFSAAILDLKLSGQDGIDVLRELRKRCPDLRVIIHTGYGSFNTAKDAVNLGAFAYVEKSGNPAELVLSVHRAVQERLSEALTRSEQQYLELIGDVKAIVWECDYPSRSFRFVNAQAELIIGYPAKNWTSDAKFWIGCIHPEDRDRYLLFFDHFADRGQDQEIDYRVKTADGRTVWLHDVVHKVSSDDGSRTILRGVMFDVTQQKAADQKLHEMTTQLAHVSRLSTMGEMVASIAHEINQPLAVISNFATAAKHVIDNTEADFDAPLSRWMQTVCDQANSCADIIRGLRRFLKKGHENRELVELYRIIEDSVKLIRCNQQYRATNVACVSTTDSPIVYANSIQLQQVIVNLLQNACDAVSQVDCPEVEVGITTHQNRARVTIADNGPGIDATKRNEIFEAFFTTKPSGMGMGLAISKTIVEAHRGTLDFDSDSSGTRFHVELPLANRRSSAVT